MSASGGGAGEEELRIAPSVARLAGALAADAVSVEVLRAWRRVGIHGVLIKGPTLAEWLYPDGVVRAYGDSDLVVSPGDRSRAERVLRELGFDEQPYADPNTSKHATPWVRERDRAVVDLHHRLWGAWGPPHDEQWEVFHGQWTEEMRVAGEAVRVPSRPARLMLVALHASQHRDLEGKPLEDLRRALGSASRAEWRSATILADRLGASREMAAGLQRTVAGASLVTQLPLLAAQSLEEPERSRLLARLRWAEAAATRGAGAVVADTLQLRAHDLRVRYPIARHGRLGLVLAGGMRIARLLQRAPGELRGVIRGH